MIFEKKKHIREPQGRNVLKEWFAACTLGCQFKLQEQLTSETDNRTKGKSGSVRACRGEPLSSEEEHLPSLWEVMATEAQTDRPEHPTAQATNPQSRPHCVLIAPLYILTFQLFKDLLICVW